MKTKLVLLTVPLLVLAAFSATAAPTGMQAGMWEITTTTEMLGMPMRMPPQVLRHCYKEENLKDAKGTLPVDKSCKVEDFKQSGNTVSWKMNCNRDGTSMVGSGEITYVGQSYTGKMSVKGKTGGMDINMVSQYSAKRIGDCK